MPVKTLIFGGTGSLGRKLIDRLLPTESVTVYSRDESKHWSIRNELAGHPQLSSLRFVVGDIRDAARVGEAIRDADPDRIIVAAALKQVDTCELSPSESVLTNLLGTQNVIRAVTDANQFRHVNRVESVLFVSTDKACAPVNVYGMCKAISERIVTSQASRPHASVTKFLCTRYGNVLESRGSIIPLFRHQAEHSEFLTVTDPDMTRYLMTLDDSVDLIKTAFEHGETGDTWIPKLPSMRIGDLAELYSERWNKPIRVIGLRPGEKQHEDLINESESVRTSDIGLHYVMRPAFQRASGPRFTYTSADNVLSKQQLRDHLNRLNVFDVPVESFKGQSIEEIITNRKE